VVEGQAARQGLEFNAEKNNSPPKKAAHFD
jgi:hypothetical protein